MSSEQQARDLINQAQKKLNSWSFFGPSNKYEDAAEFYEKAGNMFKLAQQCKKEKNDNQTMMHLPNLHYRV
jgi:alpha-soluble NSF attachment protein